MFPTVEARRDCLCHLAFVLGTLAILLLVPVPRAIALNDAQQLVVESWKLVNQSFLDPDRFNAVHWRRLRQKALETSINTSEDAYSAIEAMLAPLGDPYTRLLRPEAYSMMQSSNRGNIHGVGLQLAHRQKDKQIVVISALDSSPAAEAGIASGTLVLAVDGKLATDLGLEGTAEQLRGDVGTQVLISLEGPDGTKQDLTLERRSIDLRPVRTRRLRGDVHTLGYLRITQFSEGVPEQVRDALDELKNREVEGLVLDLRNNSGGLVSSGLAVADIFLDGGTIVETRNREGISDVIPALPQTLYNGPMVTLVNSGTASAAEILAGALQDEGRSQLFGSRTFGKGLIQTLTNLSDGSGLAITVSAYVTPSGRDIQGEGIVPDHELDLPEPLNPGGDSDYWLDDAGRWMEAKLDSRIQPKVLNP
ncbi:S41 family peptidase [cyanobiont of Ornithocercus magnificus]|nr:S41 family peptidase [cyanobiont of Ornithocercus magnificus]